jgi:hypothetical protein
MMEAVQTSETSVNSYQSTWHYNPKDRHVHTHCHENLKSYYIDSWSEASYLTVGVVRSIQKNYYSFTAED